MRFLTTIKPSMWHLIYHPRFLTFAFTHILHPISLVSPSVLDTFNINSRVWFHIVITFLVFMSISSSPLFVHFTIPAPYLIKETAYVFIAMTFLLPLNILFMINFVCLKYSSLSLILLYSKIHRQFIIFFDILNSSDDTTFSLLNTRTPHFIRYSIPISIPICILHTHSLHRSLNHL